MQGYKGAGLAVVLGMMTSFLGGTMFDDQKRDPRHRPPDPDTTGHFFQAHDIASSPTSKRSARPSARTAPVSAPRRRRLASSGCTRRATSRTPRRRPTTARVCRWSSSPWTTWSGSPSSWASNTTSSERQNRQGNDGADAAEHEEYDGRGTVPHVEWERASISRSRAYEAARHAAGQGPRRGTAIVDADGHGTTTHGLKNLRGYVTDFTSGGSTRSRTSRGRRAEGGAIIDADNARARRGGVRACARRSRWPRSTRFGSAFVRDQQPLRPFRLLGQHGRPPQHGRLRDHQRLGRHRAVWRQESLIGNNPPSWAIPTKVVDPAKKLPAADYRAGLPGHGAQRRGRQPPGHLSSAGRASAGGLGARRGRRPDERPARRGVGGTLTAVARLQGHRHGGRPVDDHVVPRRPPCQTTNAPTGPDGRSHRRPATGSGVRHRTVHGPRTLLRAGARESRSDSGVANEGGRRPRLRPWRHRKCEGQNSFSGGIPLEQFTLDDLAWVAEHLGIEYNIV